MFLGKFRYSSTEWSWAKACTILVWLAFCTRIILKFKSQPFPEGACSLFNCSFLTNPPIIYFTFFALIILAVLYVAERQMLFVTFLVSIFSIILFSLEIANGGHSSRMEILSMVFVVQFIAYLQHSLSESKIKTEINAFNLAMTYSVQIVATAYVITAFSKLQESGLDWVMESQNFAVRVVRSYSTRAIDFSDENLAIHGRAIADFILGHKTLIRFLFLSALLIELFAFIAVCSKKLARIYSVVILLLHTGMFFILGGVLISFAMLVFIYLLNLPGLFLRPNSFTVESEQKNSRNGVGIVTLINHFKIPAAYLTLSFCIGEIHPFSNFPMFASSTNNTEFYYLANENYQPVSAYEKFSIRCGEIKNMMYSEAQVEEIRVEDNQKMKIIAETVLEHIVDVHEAELAVSGYKQLMRVKRTIILSQGQLTESDFVMAKMKLKSTTD